MDYTAILYGAVLGRVGAMAYDTYMQSQAANPMVDWTAFMAGGATMKLIAPYVLGAAAYSYFGADSMSMLYAVGAGALGQMFM